MLRARQQKSGGEEGSEPPDAQSALINWVEQGDCAGSIIGTDFEEGSDHDVMGKIRRDFDAKGVVQSDHQISRTMTELMAKAVSDIKAGR